MRGFIYEGMREKLKDVTLRTHRKVSVCTTAKIEMTSNVNYKFLLKIEFCVVLVLHHLHVANMKL